jgi:BASS family bile acid:Na+ symporter
MFEQYLIYEYHVAAMQLVLAMLGIGASLRRADITRVYRFPKAFGVGIAMQVVMVPVVAVLVGRLLAPHTGIAVGLVLIAALPGGVMSNLLVYLARASLALSVALTATMTIGCLVTTPLLLRLFAGTYLPPAFVMPAGRIAFEMLVFLLVPLAVGTAVAVTLPRRREAFAQWTIRGSLVMLTVIIVGASGAGRIDPTAYGLAGYAALVVFTGVILATALLGSRAAGLSSPDRLAIGIEVGIRNINLGLLLKASIFPAVPGVADPLGDAVLFALLMYGGIGTPAAVVLTVLHRRGILVTRDWGGAG